MTLAIKILLLKKDIKQKWLAEMIGIRSTILSDFINGRRVLPFKYHSSFCKILDIDLKEFQKGFVKEMEEIEIDE